MASQEHTKVNDLCDNVLSSSCLHFVRPLLSLSGNGDLKGDWRCCSEQVTIRMHIDVSCFHPINIHQQRAKANMFPLCDFTIDETKRHCPAVYVAVLTQMGMVHQSKSWLVQDNHMQTKAQPDMTVQRWFLSSAARLHAMCS